MIAPLSAHRPLPGADLPQVMIVDATRTPVLIALGATNEEAVATANAVVNAVNSEALGFVAYDALPLPTMVERVDLFLESRVIDCRNCEEVGRE